MSSYLLVNQEYNHTSKGKPGLDQLLQTFNRKELEEMLLVCKLNRQTSIHKTVRHKDKETGEVTNTRVRQGAGTPD